MAELSQAVRMQCVVTGEMLLAEALLNLRPI
jgi:hypothetical protein